MSEYEEQVEAAEVAAIVAKRSIDAILKEPAYVAAVKKVEKDYVAEFMAAETDEARRQVWSKVRALQDLQMQLAKVQQDGKVAEIHQERRETARAARAAKR